MKNTLEELSDSLVKMFAHKAIIDSYTGHPRDTSEPPGKITAVVVYFDWAELRKNLRFAVVATVHTDRKVVFSDGTEQLEILGASIDIEMGNIAMHSHGAFIFSDVDLGQLTSKISYRILNVFKEAGWKT